MSLNNILPIENTEHLTRIAEYFHNNPNVWAARSVEDEPKTNLGRWTIMECFTEHYGKRTRHLVGYTGEGRVSSKVVKWELVKEGILATTESGRNYLLLDRPGMNGDANYVWNTWIRINNAKDVIDVTSEYWDNEACKPKLPVQV